VECQSRPNTLQETTPLFDHLREREECRWDADPGRLAVLRLTTRSKRVGYSTVMSTGLMVPSNILPWNDLGIVIAPTLCFRQVWRNLERPQRARRDRRTHFGSGSCPWRRDIPWCSGRICDGFACCSGVGRATHCSAEVAVFGRSAAAGTT